MASLPKNDDLEVLIDRLVLGVNASIVAPHPECKECDESAAANSICLDCDKYLCFSCSEHHRKARKKHNIQLLKDSEKLERKTARCLEHKKKASLYCWTCDCLICLSCAADFSHGVHEKENISAVVSRCRDLIRLATEGVEQVEKEVSEAIEKIQTVQKALEENSKSARQRVETGYKEALQKLDEEKARQIKKLDEIHYAKRDGIKRQLEQCNHMKKIVNSHLKFSSDVGQISEAGFLSIWSKVRDVLVSLMEAYKCNVPSQCCEVENIDVRAADIPNFTDKIGEVFVAPKGNAFKLPADISTAVIAAGREFLFTITCTDVFATRLHYKGELPELLVKLVKIPPPQDGLAADRGGDAGDLGGLAANHADNQGDQAAIQDDQGGQDRGEGGQDVNQGNQHGNPANPAQANQTGSGNQSAVNITCSAREGPNGSYTVKLLTHQIGLHTLTSKAVVRKDDLMDPLSLFVVPVVNDTATFIFAQSKTPLVKAKRVAIRGILCIYTDSEGNRIRTWAPRKHSFSPLPTDGIEVENIPISPEGIAIDTDNSVIIADKTKCRVLVIKRDQIQCDLELKEGEQFKGPTSIAVNKNGRIFVGDSSNIHFFHSDYSHVGTISDCRMGSVDTISIDMHENLLVVSQKLGKVYVLKEKNNNYFVVNTFGDSIIGPNRNLRNPVGIATDCRYGYTYIIERQRLCVFSIAGECLACFDKVIHNKVQNVPFIDLSGIDISKDGSVILADDGALMEICTLSTMECEKLE